MKWVKIMILMDLQDVLRSILGAYRVQYLFLRADCTPLEASALDFQFRDQLYEEYDYTAFARRIMEAVVEDTVIDYRDEFGLHYIVFEGRNAEKGSYAFFGPYLYRPYGEEEQSRLLESLSLSPESLDAIRWYFKRIPVIQDSLSWRHMFLAFLSRYLANPNLEILSVRSDHPESPRKKPAIALSSIPYATVEARYAVENAMLNAIRRGDFSEAIYQQNLFMGFTLDQRLKDRLRDAKDMIVSVNTLFRKAIEQAAVHPLYIDGISGQFIAEIEAAESMDQLHALIQKMIRHYCLLVRSHSLERYSSLVRDCLNYIDFHYMEALSLDGLATRFSANKNYLSSRFHKEVGQTVTDYINQTRVQRAVYLLGSTTMNMQTIAERCGFADSNYFARTFKKIHGQTPNEYRKSLSAAGKPGT